MGKDFEFTILDEKRKKDFIQIFNRFTLNIISPFAHRTKLPNGVFEECIYLDLDLINKKERKNLIKFLAKRFNRKKKYVKVNLGKFGVPIPIKEGIVTIKTHPLSFGD